MFVHSVSHFLFPRLLKNIAIGRQPTSMDNELLQRMKQSILCISFEEQVLATAIVWDYTENHVLILTTYHT